MALVLINLGAFRHLAGEHEQVESSVTQEHQDRRLNGPEFLFTNMIEMVVT